MVDARLIKRFPSRAQSTSFELDLHLRAAPGITALFGPSGAGKTLTLNCLAGFIKPDEGRILVDDDILFDRAARVDVPPQQRRIGYVFQDHTLFPHMTVRGNLQFAANAIPNGRRNRQRRINELLDVFELTALAGRKPSQLSGGQKQRAALARMLVTEPRLLLLDEPARGLDARLTQGFYDVLRTTRHRLNAPILLVTHNLTDCFELANAICLFADGRLLQSGPTEQVFAKPASVAVAHALGLFNTLPAEILALDPGRDTSRLQVLDQELEGPYLRGRLIGDRGFVCLRRSEFSLHPTRNAASSNQLTVNLLTTAPSAQGMRLGFDHALSIDLSHSSFAPLRGKQRLFLEIPRTAIHFVDK